MGSNVSKKRRKSSLSDAEARAKLQRKICMAEDAPGPIYDLSSCLMREVPSGTYAKCKVQRKMQLLLQDNLLTSLEEGGQLSDLASLQVLRLDHNCFSHLTSGISALSSLQVLNLSSNGLKQLPSSLGQLRQLRQLLCRGSGLQRLPDAVGQLPKLAVLDLRNNQLRDLPPLSNIGRMSELHLEGNKSLASPPPEVVEEGSDAVITFLCKEAGVEHTGPCPDDGDDVTTEGLPAGSLSCPDELDSVQEKIDLYDKLKESRRQELLELERRLTEEKSRENRRISRQDELKKQLLDELAEDQARLDADLARVAERREQDRARLLASVSALEGAADRAAAEVAAAAARLRDPAAVLARLQLDRQELEQMVIVRQEECDALRHKEVMESMEQLMRESVAIESQLQQYQQGRDLAVQQALSQDHQTDLQLQHLLEMKGSEQQARIQQLLKEEAFQREAFFNLYMLQDASRQSILHQISEAEEALMRLALVEATQKDASKESEMARVSEKRRHLASLLAQLVEQQTAREQELKKRLAEMDEQRRGEMQHYWLVQYQRLLDNKPERLKSLEDTLDADVSRLLQQAGAADYLTLFAAGRVQYKQLLYMDDADLKELGVNDLSTRASILRQIAFAKDEDLEKPRVPSAPPAPLEEDSTAPPAAEPAAGPTAEEPGAAPGAEPGAEAQGAEAKVDLSCLGSTTHTELECVICMDNKTEVIFLSCGHLCTCRQCASPLQHCPMCRQTVLQKLVLKSVL